MSLAMFEKVCAVLDFCTPDELHVTSCGAIFQMFCIEFNPFFLSGQKIKLLYT